MTTAKDENNNAAQSPPSPADRPGCDIVVYDGNCRFCQGQVAKLSRWDRRNQLAFLSLHDESVRSLCPDLSHDQLMEQLYLVTTDGRRFGGAAAFRYLSRKLSTLWWLAPLMHFPFSLPFWQWLYRKVAERRYRISGGDEDCQDSCGLHFGNKQRTS